MDLLVSTFFLIFLVVEIALLYTIAWRYTYHIYAAISYDQRRRLHRFLRLLIIAPAFILLIIFILIIWAWKTNPYERLVHALLILSLWLPVTWMLFETILTYRANAQSSHNTDRRIAYGRDSNPRVDLHQSLLRPLPEHEHWIAFIDCRMQPGIFLLLTIRVA